MWWLVSPQNPLKSPVGMESLAGRMGSAAAIVQGHPRIRVSAIETQLGTRFTADTLKVLKRRFPRASFVWLMGADNLGQIPRWDRWQRIFASLPVAVFDRSPYSYKALAGKAARRFARARLGQARAAILARTPAPAWVYLHQRRHPASATAIRGRMNGAVPT